MKRLASRLRAALRAFRSPPTMPQQPQAAGAAAPSVHEQRLAALRELSAPVAVATPAGDGAERTADHWGRDARARLSQLNALRYWTSHPVTAREINRQISGDAALGWMGYVKRRYFATPARRGLSLGSGSGAAVTDAALLDIARHMVGVDISPEAVAVSMQRAQQAGVADRVEFRVGDLNTLAIDGVHDFVMFEQSLHHVDRLDALLDRCRDALVPAGLLVINEYVGPDRFQWSDTSERMMNDLLHLLPRRLRIDPVSGHEKVVMQRATPEQVIAVDPSEAIHSSRILQACGERFELVERRDFGGTLLQFMLADIVASFDPDDERDAAMLRLLTWAEAELVKAGAIESDFVFAVYRRRD